MNCSLWQSVCSKTDSDAGDGNCLTVALYARVSVVLSSVSVRQHASTSVCASQPFVNIIVFVVLLYCKLTVLFFIPRRPTYFL